MASRVPTIKACVKRIKSITLTDLKSLRDTDLKELLGLDKLMGPIAMELGHRQMFTNQVSSEDQVSAA